MDWTLISLYDLESLTGDKFYQFCVWKHNTKKSLFFLGAYGDKAAFVKTGAIQGMSVFSNKNELKASIFEKKSGAPAYTETEFNWLVLPDKKVISKVPTAPKVVIVEEYGF